MSERVVASPLGPIRLVAEDGALVRCGFEAGEGADADPVLDQAEAALAAYFAGELGALDSVPVAPAGTPFQRAVWTTLRRIPAGQTASYSTVAAAVGMPSAVRAVGAANGQNPIALFVPCHRVIGKDGSLVGYAAGVERKRWLLAHESPQGSLV